MLINSSGSPCPPRILIFSHFTERDGKALLTSIANALENRRIRMQHLILTTNDIRRDGEATIGNCSNAKGRLQAYSIKDRNMRNRYRPEIHDLYAETWKSLDPKTEISRERTIEGALDRAKEISTQDGIQALVTGSVHLISGALTLLE